MIGIGINTTLRVISGGGGPSYDADAQAFFDRVTTAGGTLTTTEKNATNQLVLDMKSAGIWTAMRAVYPMVGASAAACAQNLKSSSFTGTFSSGWTFASTGVTPNGTSAYMTTGVNPSTQLLQNSTHLSFYSRTNTTDSPVRVDIGLNSGTNVSLYLSCKINSSYGPLSNINNIGIKLLSLLPNSLGFYISSRVVSTERKIYANNSLFDTYTVNSQSPANDNIILGSNLTGEFSNRQCAFASLGDGLTDTQASNFYTAVQAFQTTLNRYVGAPWYDNGNLLLDDYPSAAAAYSVRKLRNNYIGGPIRVRRSSDNAEQDIYFDANGNLDTAQLTSFCGAGNGFVTTWYDQSGNARNATQSTAANQPQIVSSGSVILENGKPSVQFDGSNDMLKYTGLLYTTNTVFGTAVFSHNSAAIYSQILSQNSGGVGRSSLLQLNDTSPRKSAYFFNNGTSYNNLSSGTISANTQTLVTNYSYSNNYYNALNGGSANNNISGQAFTPVSASGSSIGGTPVNTDFLNGIIQEILVWNSNQSSNRTGIETNINDFYSIY